MDGVELCQCYTASTRRVYFLQLSLQDFLWSFGSHPGTHLIDLEGWKADSTLEPTNGFEPGTSGLVIQRRIQYAPIKQI